MCDLFPLVEEVLGKNPFIYRYDLQEALVWRDAVETRMLLRCC